MRSHLRTVLPTLLILPLLSALAVAVVPNTDADWTTDRGWHQGKAEWALYDAVRPIYGTPRHYEATIFTNTQHMDPTTTTKASDHRIPGATPVFKHNLSEMIPTEHYTYRFLTTAFVRTDGLDLYKLVMSSQEDCGTSYKQFQRTGADIEATQFVYFPDAGEPEATIAAADDLVFHDTLSLILRGFEMGETREVRLVTDQTDTHATPLRPAPATIRSLGAERITVPYGEVETHHVQVSHAVIGGTETSDYWMATAPGMRGVMVRYRGPFGVEYRLKRLAWWAYWAEPRPE